MSYSKTIIYINSNIFSTKRYLYLLMVMLLGIKFFGLILFSPIYSFAIQNIMIGACLFLGVRKTDEYSSTIKLLLLSLVFTWISSDIFENQNIYTSYRAGFIFYYFVFFFAIAAINPSIKEIEKSIMTLGCMAAVVYIIQYNILPVPIVENANVAWRLESGNELEISRFSVNGDSVMVIAFLMCGNRLFKEFSWSHLALILVFVGCLVAHGYRSLIVALIIAYIVMYMIYFKRKFSKAAIWGIVVSLLVFEILSNIGGGDIVSFMIDKSKNQAEAGSKSLDRLMEFNYFFNKYLKNPLEWIFGGGFIGDSSYGNHMKYIQNFGSKINGRVNWVDLGFIGMSFMGGLVMVGLWIKLLVMCMRKVPVQYYYIGAFSLYIILSTLTLNQAFDGNNIVVQCLAFFLFFKVRSVYGYRRSKLRKRSSKIRI
jgi:hypothetical protein